VDETHRACAFARCNEWIAFLQVFLFLKADTTRLDSGLSGVVLLLFDESSQAIMTPSLVFWLTQREVYRLECTDAVIFAERISFDRQRLVAVHL
jgi:hypothetical protein